MAKLSYLDKELLEKLFGMAGGYVLGFSNPRYSAFFRDVDIDIDHQRFCINGGSKANRMRAFCEVGTDAEVGRVLESLFEYIDAVSPEEAGGPVEGKHRDIVHRLLGSKPKEEKGKVLTESEFLEFEFGKLDLGRLSLDVSIEVAIRQRVSEIETCLFKGPAPLAAVFLCGSTLEGLLLNTATKRPEEFNKAEAAPKCSDGKVKQFHDWSLNDLINVAFEAGMIGLDVKKYSHVLRDFRNYIHPYEQARSQFKPDIHTARISWQVLQAAIANLCDER